MRLCFNRTKASTEHASILCRMPLDSDGECRQCAEEIHKRCCTHGLTLKGGCVKCHPKKRFS